MKLPVHQGKSVLLSSYLSYLLLEMSAFVREIHLVVFFFFFFHSFFILFTFAVMIFKSQDKTLFGFSIQRKRLSVLKPAIHLCWCLFLLTDAEVSARKKTFAEVQTERQDQAERTVLIKCPSKINEKKLLQYLSSHGNVKSHFFFENRVSNFWCRIKSKLIWKEIPERKFG